MSIGGAESLIGRSAVVSERRRASADELHHRDLALELGIADRARAAAVWCDFAAPALVLGSRQPSTLADGAALADRGIELVKRRSGGGAVLMVPGELVWIDLVAGAGVFPDDVRASMIAAGEIWVGALRGLDLLAPTVLVEVYDGPMVPGGWGDLICFAGLGAGEVLVDGSKLVGLSQRRTRSHVRISGAIHHRSSVAATVPLLRGMQPADEPPPAAVVGAFDPVELTGALADSLRFVLG